MGVLTDYRIQTRIVCLRFFDPATACFFKWIEFNRQVTPCAGF
jgi:hypothetical protein